MSVIIPVYNGGDAFLHCLDAISLCDPAPHEVIVVADGESDGLWRKAEDYGFRTFLFDTNGGPARARNKGAELSTGNILFFTDADVVVRPDTIGRIIDSFKENPDISALIGSYDDSPGDPGFLSQYKNLMNHYMHQAASREAFTFWSACGAIKTDVFFDAGMFDIAYGKAMIEDIELGYRLIRKGLSIRLNKELLVCHLKKWDIKSLLKADIFYRAIPWSELIIKEKKIQNDLNLKGEHRLSAMLVMLMIFIMFLFLVSGKFIGYLMFPIVLLLWLNRDLYLFYYQKRGGGFALKTIPWHWLYYFYSSVSFAYVYASTAAAGIFKR